MIGIIFILPVLFLANCSMPALKEADGGNEKNKMTRDGGISESQILVGNNVNIKSYQTDNYGNSKYLYNEKFLSTDNDYLVYKVLETDIGNQDINILKGQWQYSHVYDKMRPTGKSYPAEVYGYYVFKNLYPYFTDYGTKPHYLRASLYETTNTYDIYQINWDVRSSSTSVENLPDSYKWMYIDAFEGEEGTWFYLKNLQYGIYLRCSWSFATDVLCYVRRGQPDTEPGMDNSWQIETVY
jgi:hypothetical protein